MRALYDYRAKAKASYLYVSLVFGRGGLDFTLVVIAAGVTGYGKTDANIGRPGGM